MIEVRGARVATLLPPDGWRCETERDYRHVMALFTAVCDAYHADDPEGDAMLERLCSLERQYWAPIDEQRP